MIFDESRPVQFRDELPKVVDVLVIGAGVIGISTAYYLAKAGVSVCVCEKGRVAGEQSGRNWGWIRQQGRDPAEVSLAMEANRLWEEISGEVDEDIGFARTGVLFAAADPEHLATLEAWLDVAQQHQLDTRLLTGAEVDAILKGPPSRQIGGLYTPSDAKAEPFRAVPALTGALKRRGGIVRENCAVRSLITEGGAVTGVVTEDGEVRAQSVVCAGGAWTTRFLGNLGVRLPQLTVRGTVVRTAPAKEIISGAVLAGHLGIRRRQDGGYTIATGLTHEHFVNRDSFRFLGQFIPTLRSGAMSTQLRFRDGLWSRMAQESRWSADEITPFETTRVLNPPPSPVALANIEKGLRRWLPELSGVPIEQAWAGMIDTTPDVVPVMDAIPGYTALFVATGFSGHGFGIGPAAGKTMADMVMGKAVSHDLHRFRFSRFSDGSKMVPGPGI